MEMFIPASSFCRARGCRTKGPIKGRIRPNSGGFPSHNVAARKIEIKGSGRFDGHVIEGNQFGRKIGFPTANINCCGENKQIPEEGVYVVRVDLDEEQFGGMLNIGTRPTVDKSMRKSIEVHIFDFTRDLYGKKLKVSFLHKLRDEMKFNNTDELRVQLAKDRINALALLG